MSAISVIGVGKYIPKKRISNQQIEMWAGIPAQEIVDKTGIQCRFIVEDNQSASEMSALAAIMAIDRAGIQSEQIGMIVTCGFSGDYIYPALACKVQQMIGAKNAGSFDIMANCTGFQVGLTVMADRMNADSSIDYGLVIGNALQSRYVNWKDPGTAMYFGDGAGAAVLGRVPEGYGFLSSEIMTNSSVYEALRMRGGGSSFPLRAENINQGLQYYEMNGLEVWKQVIQYQPLVIRRSLEKIGMTIENVNFFIFHQANFRLLEYLMKKMKQPLHNTYINVDKIGNIADASIAIAMCEAHEAGLLRRDQIVVVSGVGAGFTFGSSVMRWY
jgi:3-oxoacyl-[acyl-carrier-protein] synthase-3